MQDCIFCKIASGALSCRKIWEDEDFMSFYDIKPKAKIHALVIPKQHVKDLSSLDGVDSDYQGRFLQAVHHTVRELNLKHFKLHFNNGEDSGQEVLHLHAHILQF